MVNKILLSKGITVMIDGEMVMGKTREQKLGRVAHAISEKAIEVTNKKIKYALIKTEKELLHTIDRYMYNNVFSTYLYDEEKENEHYEIIGKLMSKYLDEYKPLKKVYVLRAGTQGGYVVKLFKTGKIFLSDKKEDAKVYNYVEKEELLKRLISLTDEKVDWA